MTLTGHTVKAYEKDLEALTAMIVRLGGLVESHLQAALQAVAQRDLAHAHQIVRDDDRIDDLEREVGDAAVRLLALRQPLAHDLRITLAAIKIASDLERIGDLATNIAKRVRRLVDMPRISAISGLIHMGEEAQGQLHAAIDAYVRDDVEAASAVWHGDERVDEFYVSLFRELLTYMMEDARMITPCAHLLFIAKNLERVGDHCTNIAETIHYQVTGERMPELTRRAANHDDRG